MTIPPVPPPGPPVLMQVIAQVSDGLVLAYGQFPFGTDDPEHQIVDLIDQAEVDKLSEAGSKYVSPEGVITVQPLDSSIQYARIREQRLAAEAQAQAELLALENPDYLVILSASGGI